jgi:hypothetical protein
MIHSMIFGFVGAAVGLACAIYLARQGSTGMYHAPWIASTVGAFAACWLTWQLMVERPRNYRVTKGIVAGLFAVGASHFATWVLILWVGWLCGNVLRVCADETSANPLLAVPVSVLFAAISLETMGWTLLVGAVLGAAYAKFRAAQAEKDD